MIGMLIIVWKTYFLWFQVAVDVMRTCQLIFPSDDDENNPGFHVQWDNGSFTQDCMTGLTTEIIFLCKETSEAKDWTAQNQTANLAHASYDNPCGVSYPLM